jgi:hypothetical protein
MRMCERLMGLALRRGNYRRGVRYPFVLREGIAPDDASLCESRCDTSMSSR